MLGTRVTFPSRGKSPKARQGLRPLESPSAESPPLLRSLTHRAGLPSATKIDRFATLSLWANRSYFFLWFHRGNALCFQSVARQDCPRGCRRFYTPATNTARAQGRGIKGGEAPFAGGPGTRRFLAYLCLLSLREKVGRGRRGGAPAHGEQEPSLPTCSRGAKPLAKRLGCPTHPSVEREKGGAQRGRQPPRIGRGRSSRQREKKRW